MGPVKWSCFHLYVILDIEAGMKSVQDWRGASIPVRSFTDFRDLVVLIGGADPAQHPQSWYGTERHAWLQAQHRDSGIEGFLAARRVVFSGLITNLRCFQCDKNCL